jgi:hypothetical protein
MAFPNPDYIESAKQHPKSGIRYQVSEKVTARLGGRGNVGARGFTSFHGAKRRMNF